MSLDIVNYEHNHIVQTTYCSITYDHHLQLQYAYSTGHWGMHHNMFSFANAPGK